MTSKERIFEAAFTVFAKKGRHGAKMEEIAAEAGINKAMIYYIFSSKDNLYEEVIRKIIVDQNKVLTENMNECLCGQMKPDEVLKAWITKQFDLMWRNPKYTRITIEALSSNAAEIHAIVLENKTVYEKVNTFLDRIMSVGKEIGLFRKEIDTQQLFASAFSLNLMFFMSRPIFEILGILAGEESELIEKHKKHVSDLIFNGVLVK